jgi:hypothetical protein
MLPESIHKTLLHVWKTLRPLKHPTALLGGAALTFWRHARFTKDVDFLLAVRQGEIDQVVAALRQARVVPRRYPPPVPLDGIDLVQFDYQLPDSFVEVRVDLQFAKDEYFQQLLDRRVSQKLADEEEPVDIVACEDLILLKLSAGRIIDRSDAAYLLRINGRVLDLEYLLRWAKKLRVGRELREVWDEAFPGYAPPRLPPEASPH